MSDSFRKWNITFYDGKSALMLTHECPDIQSALDAANERFGISRVRGVNDDKNELLNNKEIV